MQYVFFSFKFEYSLYIFYIKINLYFSCILLSIDRPNYLTFFIKILVQKGLDDNIGLQCIQWLNL